jgi:hypothetical protein
MIQNGALDINTNNTFDLGNVPRDSSLTQHDCYTFSGRDCYKFVGLRLVEYLEVSIVIKKDFCRRVDKNLWFEYFLDILN